VYLVGYSKIRNLVFRLNQKPVTRFVTFHNIPPNAVSQFRSNLYFLKQKTHVVSIEEFFLNKLDSNKVNVVITFDDGYKSWVSHALPILKEFRLPAIFFVTSGFIGLTEEQETTFIRTKLGLKQDSWAITRGLEAEDVQKIVGEGFSIGGHTLNHLSLGALEDGDEIRYEIAEDKLRLEKMSGAKIEYFAFPSGVHYNCRINLVEVLKEMGYKGGVTTVPGINDVRSNPFLLHRELTGASMSGIVFRARVLGNHDVVRFMKGLFLKILNAK